MGKHSQGRRLDAGAEDRNQYPYPKLEPGDYGKDSEGIWYCRPPWPHGCGCLAHHRVVEHEDGTITVSPSIEITCHIPDTVVWHGYLERGVWKEI